MDVALIKPRLRGYFHQIGFFISLPLMLLALWIASQQSAPYVVEMAGLYSFSLSALLGTSALYHRIDWLEKKRLWMRRADRTMIFVLIAGTYTPFGVLIFDGWINVVTLWVLWVAAISSNARFFSEESLLCSKIIR